MNLNGQENIFKMTLPILLSFMNIVSFLAKKMNIVSFNYTLVLSAGSGLWDREVDHWE